MQAGAVIQPDMACPHLGISWQVLQPSPTWPTPRTSPHMNWQGLQFSLTWLSLLPMCTLDWPNLACLQTQPTSMPMSAAAQPSLTCSSLDFVLTNRSCDLAGKLSYKALLQSWLLLLDLAYTSECYGLA